MSVKAHVVFRSCLLSQFDYAYSLSPHSETLITSNTLLLKLRLK